MVISQEISACQSTETCCITQIFFQILFEPNTTLNIVIFDSQPQILNGIRVKFKFGSFWALWGESGVIIISSASPHGFNNSYFGFLLQASIINGDLSYCVVQNFLQVSVFFSPRNILKFLFYFHLSISGMKLDFTFPFFVASQPNTDLTILLNPKKISFEWVWFTEATSGAC